MNISLRTFEITFLSTITSSTTHVDDDATFLSRMDSMPCISVKNDNEYFNYSAHSVVHRGTNAQKSKEKSKCLNEKAYKRNERKGGKVPCK